jgi:hypothetical protein
LTVAARCVLARKRFLSKELMMIRSLLVASCVAAALASGPLSAQTPPATPPSPAVTPQGSPPPVRIIPGDVRPGERTDSPGARAIDDGSPSAGGRISETAPAPRAGTGPSRFRDDLASCSARERDERASCRQEMFAARAQGLYRN